MDPSGLLLCSRYAFPPNSLSLCGPDKKNELLWYSSTGYKDQGNTEILKQFSTLYPYLSLIARENKIKDAFEKRVIEAYWLGNSLLNYVKINSLGYHLFDKLQLKKKLDLKQKLKLDDLLNKTILPCHAFHVLNIFKRTGNFTDVQSVYTMDACIVNFGRVKKILTDSFLIHTKPLISQNNKILFGSFKKRLISFQGKNDLLVRNIKLNDFVSYHWGYFCEKLSIEKLNNLTYYTNLAISLANSNNWY
jgi:hypothetical protein